MDIVVESPGCGVAFVGGVIGMLCGVVDDEEDGFTELSVEVDEDEVVEESVVEPLIVDPLIVPPFEDGTVAEVSVEAPVLAEPAHQSRLARVFGEAFI
ncbi:hypothetical protein [uncultured Caulobacter sp.]|uniref:hypothetical protein n=1 Tax=uncultured Caulobacter sp. TaxID=158749 RepID=UPI00263696AF|nr:hypothetical protein [uncultured Caulobacter sp.]